MSDNEFTCQDCGDRAIVHIGHDPEYGNVIRDFCLRCAAADEAAQRRPQKGLNLPAVVVSSGLTILLLSVFADAMTLGHSSGFGWKQDAGIIAGVCLVLVSLAFRVPTLLAIGLQVSGLSLLADWLKLGDGEGFGEQQLIGTIVGALLILLGLAWSRRRETNWSLKNAPARADLRWEPPSLQTAGWTSGQARMLLSSSHEKSNAARTAGLT
jgi:hypothetical protein